MVGCGTRCRRVCERLRTLFEKLDLETVSRNSIRIHSRESGQCRSIWKIDRQVCERPKAPPAFVGPCTSCLVRRGCLVYDGPVLLGELVVCARAVAFVAKVVCLGFDLVF